MIESGIVIDISINVRGLIGLRGVAGATPSLDAQLRGLLPENERTADIRLLYRILAQEVRMAAAKEVREGNRAAMSITVKSVLGIKFKAEYMASAWTLAAEGE